MDDSLLIINAGSSTIKFALFTTSNLELIYRGEIDNVLENPICTVFEKNKKQTKESIPDKGFDCVWNYLFNWLSQKTLSFTLKAIGHRESSVPYILILKVVMSLFLLEASINNSKKNSNTTGLAGCHFR